MYEGQMITSGLNNSGDVILAPEKKSNKKWIIIGAIALVIIVVFLVMFLVPKGGVNMSGNAKSAFNRYANYLLFGQDSTDDIGQYSEEEYYYYYGLVDMSYNERDSFFTKAESLLNDFEKQLGSGTNSEFMEEFTGYKNSFELTKMIYLAEGFDEEDFSNSSYDNVREFGGHNSEYEDAYERYLSGMRSSGCVNAEDVYDPCETYLNENLLAQIEDEQFELIKLQDDAATNTVRGCFELANKIYGRKSQPQIIEGEDDASDEDDDEEADEA